MKYWPLFLLALVASCNVPKPKADVQAQDSPHVEGSAVGRDVVGPQTETTGTKVGGDGDSIMGWIAVAALGAAVVLGPVGLCAAVMIAARLGARYYQNVLRPQRLVRERLKS